MTHVLYGFIAGFRYRRQLALILRSSPNGVQTHAVDPAQLKAEGATVMALDFDGVLAPHGMGQPIPEAAEWLSHCCSTFGEDRIYILSNKPTPERSAWFRSHFPGIRFISGVRKKPYPDGLQKVIERSGAEPGEVMLLDDRLLTGVLATCLAGTGVTYINRPYSDFRGNPAQELFFAALRTVEQILINLVPDNYTERSNR
jgi:predicted HAD superfamily phosphohydrolase YqeG